MILRFGTARFLAAAAKIGIAGLIGLTFGASAAHAQDILGAGSTFVYPAMSKWVYDYEHANSSVHINYQSVGSGAGIAQYKAGTVDFGATDAPLANEELAAMPLPTLHIPVALGSVVLSYNLPGVGPGLRLSGDVIAGIFLGTIKNWSDPAVKKLNPSVALPNLAITVCHRSDGSGTSYIFTDYLCAVSAGWKSKIGRGKTVSWPVGLGGKGSEGVAGLIKDAKGSIGYVELAYALQNKLPYGPIRNRSGNFVLASVRSTTAAAGGAIANLKADVRAPIVDAKGVNSYPICGFTYVLIARAPRDATHAKAVVDFLKWVIGPGQKLVADLYYAPLPESLVALNQRALGEIKTK